MQYAVELQPPHPNVPKGYSGVPLPASFIIDREGIVQGSSRIDIPGEVMNPAAIFELL